MWKRGGDPHSVLILEHSSFSCFCYSSLCTEFKIRFVSAYLFLMTSYITVSVHRGVWEERIA